MKKNLVLTGLLSVLLMAGMMFIACPMDSGDDGDGLPVPKPDELPELPDNIGYVTNKAEAIALLNGLRAVFFPVNDAIASLIEANDSESDSNNGYKSEWSVKDDTSIPGLKVNSTGENAGTADPPDFMEGEDYIPKAGDSGTQSMTEDTTVDFSENKSAGEAVVYKDSRIVRKIRLFQESTVTSVTESSLIVSVKYSQNDSNVYSLTASNNEKGGKIILDAKIQGSLNKPLDYYSEDGPTVITFSGSLKVYGANNTEVYVKNIVTQNDYREVLDYFQ